MRSVGELIRARLESLGLWQKDYAERIGVDPSVVTRVLDGERRVPVDQVDQWIAGLQLVGEEAEDLTIAIHLSWSTDYTAALVERLRRENRELLGLLLVYEDRVNALQAMVDAISGMRGLRAAPFSDQHEDPR